MAEGEAGFHDKSTLDKASRKNGKLDKPSPLAQLPKQPNTTRIQEPRHTRSITQVLKCPECSSTRLYKDGLRYLTNGATVQRWLCRECSYRFSDRRPLQSNLRWQINSPSALLSNRQVCDCLIEASKNLAEVETRQEPAPREGTPQTANIKGEILTYIWHLKKQGRCDGTIQGYRQKLTQLMHEGVNLHDPESVKEFLAKKSWCEGSKFYASVVYDGFAKFLRLTWEKPNYKPSRKIPFIPLETEIDQLIACTGKNISALLQLLKETALRVGEALSLKLTSIDEERNVIVLNTPEKGSEPRIFKVSTTLITKLNQLPKNSE